MPFLAQNCFPQARIYGEKASLFFSVALTNTPKGESCLMRSVLRGSGSSRLFGLFVVLSDRCCGHHPAGLRRNRDALPAHHRSAAARILSFSSLECWYLCYVRQRTDNSPAICLPPSATSAHIGCRTALECCAPFLSRISELTSAPYAFFMLF